MLVDPDVDSLKSGLERAIEDRALRERLSVRARSRVEAFRWDEMFTRTRRLLQEVAGEAKSKSSR